MVVLSDSRTIRKLLEGFVNSMGANAPSVLRIRILRPGSLMCESSITRDEMFAGMCTISQLHWKHAVLTIHIHITAFSEIWPTNDSSRSLTLELLGVRIEYSISVKEPCSDNELVCSTSLPIERPGVSTKLILGKIDDPIDP